MVESLKIAFESLKRPFFLSCSFNSPLELLLQSPYRVVKEVPLRVSAFSSFFFFVIRNVSPPMFFFPGELFSTAVLLLNASLSPGWCRLDVYGKNFFSTPALPPAVPSDDVVFHV